MAEKPEVPEAKDPYERRVALTIACLAVLLSIIAVVGENAKIEGLLSATRASNAWAYFQSKSIKEHSFALQRELLELLSGIDQNRREAAIKSYAAKVSTYEKEKDEIRVKAEKLEHEVEQQTRVNDRCDLAGLQLQIAIVLGSIAILVRWRTFWFLAMCLGLSGTLTGLTSFFIHR